MCKHPASWWDHEWNRVLNVLNVCTYVRTYIRSRLLGTYLVWEPLLYSCMSCAYLCCSVSCPGMTCVSVLTRCTLRWQSVEAGPQRCWLVALTTTSGATTQVHTVHTYIQSCGPALTHCPAECVDAVWLVHVCVGGVSVGE